MAASLLQMQSPNSQHTADSDDIHMDGLPCTMNSDKDTRPPCNIALTLSWGVCSVMGPPSSRGLRACSNVIHRKGTETAGVAKQLHTQNLEGLYLHVFCWNNAVWQQANHMEGSRIPQKCD